jgi:hypothetical protein
VFEGTVFEGTVFEGTVFEGAVFEGMGEKLTRPPGRRIRSSGRYRMRPATGRFLGSG